MSLTNPFATTAASLDEEEKSLGFRPVSREDEEKVSGQLDTLIADPAFTDKPDREFQSHVHGQFAKVFPDPKPPVDEFGKLRRTRAATTQLDAFKPKPDPVNARPPGSVGAGGTNTPGDVWSFKKGLAAADGAGLDLTRERSDDAGPSFIDRMKRFQTKTGLEADGIANPGGPTATALQAQLASNTGLSSIASTAIDRNSLSSDQFQGQTAQKSKLRRIKKLPKRPVKRPRDDEGVRIDAPTMRSDWPQSRPAPVTAGAVLAKYPDGRLYLVMRHNRKAPFTGNSREEAEVVRSRLDIETFRKEDGLLPPFMTPREREFADKRGRLKERDAGIIVVNERGGSPRVDGPMLIDPDTRQPVRVAGTKILRMSRIEAEAAGLGRYIPTPRSVSVVDEALAAEGQSLEVIQRLLPELMKKIMKLKTRKR